MKHEKCYLCLRTRVTLVPGPYTHQGRGSNLVCPLALPVMSGAEGSVVEGFARGSVSQLARGPVAEINA